MSGVEAASGRLGADRDIVTGNSGSAILRKSPGLDPDGLMGIGARIEACMKGRRNGLADQAAIGAKLHASG